MNRSLSFSRRSAIAGCMGALAGGSIISACSARGIAAQNPRPDLYACDGCEAALEKDVARLTYRASLASDQEPGERLTVRGRVCMPDGVTPAAGVIVYAHHTNAEGLYAGGDPSGEGSARHGRLKGWVVTDVSGRYRFDTVKPAPYPTMTLPAHIHLYIAEANREPYYVDDIVFEGEFGVDETYRSAQELRGGTGIVRLQKEEDGILLAERDIVLERHP